MASDTPYPGDRALPGEVLRLADEYRAAAAVLRAQGRPRDPGSWAPFRLAAIHALELYLNAFLRANGCSAADVRGLQHDLSRRLDHHAVAALRLRRRTAGHLRELTVARGYLLARYEPSAVEPCTRLHATLTEVAGKVGAAVGSGPG